MTTTPTVYQAAFAEGTAHFDGRTVAQLRKLASGKVKGASRLPKSALVAELAKLHAQDSERKGIAAEQKTRADAEKPTKTTATARKTKTQSRPQAKPVKAGSDAKTAAKTDKAGKPFKSTAAPKIGRKMCQICSKRPVDQKTNGRDSTLCAPCWDYAGWENTHSDNGHEGQGDLPTAPKELLDEMKNCPVCLGQDPANDEVKTKANGSKPGRKVSKPAAVESKSFDAKAKAFAAIAKAAGWSSRVKLVDQTSAQVIATLGAETVSMVWDRGAYQYDLSEHKGEKGRKAKIRNASAARKIVESA